MKQKLISKKLHSDIMYFQLQRMFFVRLWVKVFYDKDEYRQKLQHKHYNLVLIS